MARQIKTSTIPRFEVAQQSQPTAEEAPVLKDQSLDMEVLGAVPDGEFTATLEPLVLAYEDWIDSQESRIGQPDLEEFNPQALAAITSDNEWTFTDERGTKYTYVGELRTLNSRKKVSQLMTNFNRVGVDELEWLRRNSG